MKKIYFLFCMLLLLFTACKQQAEGIKSYDAQTKVVNVQNRLHDITISDVDISDFGSPFLLNQYLIISDYKSFEKLIHIFDKNTFRYLTSVGERGQGPSEITNMGEIVPDPERNTFYVIDHGKQAFLSFPMDSVLANPDYKPVKKADINRDEFPFKIQYVSDTLSYALFMRVLNPGDYIPVVAKWNMQTGKADFMPYAGHPEIEKKRVSFAVSPEHNLYIEGYWYHDLMTICSLDGELKYTLYGKKFDNTKSNQNAYFEDVFFCEDKIVVTYWGDTRLYQRNGGEHAHYPDKLLIFDLQGNYMKTLQVGFPIINICYDAEKNRFIMNLDDEKQLVHLDMEGLL